MDSIYGIIVYICFCSLTVIIIAHVQGQRGTLQVNGTSKISASVKVLQGLMLDMAAVYTAAAVSMAATVYTDNTFKKC